MRTKRVVLFSCMGLCLLYLLTTTGRYYSLYQDYMHNPRSRLNLSRLSTEDHSSTSSAPPFTAVIILTYMRSGSSLTGDILQQSPGAFYIYEPLHGLEKLANSPGSNITFINGTVRKWPFHYENEAVSVLHHWLTCQVTKLPQMNGGFLGFGIKTKQYRTCYKDQYSHTRNRSAAMIKCASKLETVCETSPVRVLKVIRISLEAIKQLMSEFIGLKIIHLVRDPRATLNSQSKFGMCSAAKGGQYGCTNKFCSSLENDGLQEEMIAKKYPGRIRRVFYEDIALNPVETSKQMFDFIGTSFTQQAEKYIYNITSAGNDNNCNICTTRSNSTLYVDSWRTKIHPDLLNIIENRCNYVLRRYNYTFYSNLNENVVLKPVK